MKKLQTWAGLLFPSFTWKAFRKLLRGDTVIMATLWITFFCQETHQLKYGTKQMLHPNLGFGLCKQKHFIYQRFFQYLCSCIFRFLSVSKIELAFYVVFLISCRKAIIPLPSSAQAFPIFLSCAFAIVFQQPVFLPSFSPTSSPSPSPDRVAFLKHIFALHPIAWKFLNMLPFL